MKQFLFPVFFTLMVIASSAEAATVKKRSLEDSVVIFEPRVSLVEGGLPCQGVLKTDREFVIVETLTACAEDVVKKIGDGQSVLLYRDGRKLVGMVKALVLHPSRNDIFLK